VAFAEPLPSTAMWRGFEASCLNTSTLDHSDGSADFGSVHQSEKIPACHIFLHERGRAYPRCFNCSAVCIARYTYMQYDRLET
jgi:hypothetical protein